jgi:hypothetical protein
MNTQTNTPEQGTFLSLSNFVEKYNFTEIVPEIRKNSNGYPFVTFLNSKNVATNVYFGSSISDSYSEGTKITSEMLKGLQAYEYLREDGGLGLRLVSKNAGNRVSISSLL